VCPRHQKFPIVHIAINSREATLAAAAQRATIAFVVNGDSESAMGYRAREMASRIGGFDIRIAYRSRSKLASILDVLFFLIRLRPALTYVFDISYSGIVAAILCRLVFRNCLIVETGDAITELVRSTGSRGRVGLWLTGLLERFSFRAADRVVVRGSFHKELLARQGIDADVIQDGVDTHRFTPADVGDLRKRYGLDGALTVGLVGSSVWSEKLHMCYGWELVEVLRLLKDKPVKGVMIGSGSGISHLKALCREYDIEGKIIFLGHVPYEKLALHLNLIDICLSTQTNDVVGKVRTTGKLPLYLAAGRYILASNVGEAARVLEKDMLVDYVGVKDPHYSEKLKDRIRAILDHPELLNCSDKTVALARKHFDYGPITERMIGVLNAALAARLVRA
jgi:glycosyltransferase involved in cell wall biosynthesis